MYWLPSLTRKKIEREQKQGDSKKLIDFLPLEEIKTILLENENREENIKAALVMALNAEFQGDVITKDAEAPSSVVLYNGAVKPYLSFGLQMKKTHEERLLSLSDVVISDDELPFTDTTFIESPMILSLFLLLEGAVPLFGSSDDDTESYRGRLGRRSRRTTLHTIDLLRKMKEGGIFLPTEGAKGSNDFAQQIAEIIQGFMRYDQLRGNFFFERYGSEGKESTTHPLVNVASGIKSFGLLQILLEGKTLKKQSLIIIDEPENHLHPVWQTRYAQLLVNLVKQGYYILVTSHSSHFISALQKFSAEDDDVFRRTHYYLSEKDAEGAQLATITEVTSDLDKIHKKFADPYDELIWGAL